MLAERSASDPRGLGRRASTFGGTARTGAALPGRRVAPVIDLLRTHLAPYRRDLAIVIGLLVLQVLGTLYLPELNADIINNGVAKGDTSYIIRVGGLMLLVAFLVAVAAIVGLYFASRTSMSVGRDMRARVFRAVQTFSLREMNTFGAPTLITRNTNDVQQVQMFLQMALTVMVTAPLMAIGGVIMAYRQDGPLSLLLLVIVPIMMLVIGGVMVRAVPLFRAMQVKIDRINLILRENLTGIRVIRAFVRTEHEEAALRRGQRRPHRHDPERQPPVRPDDARADADHEPVERGGGLVRRAAHRRPARCRSAT